MDWYLGQRVTREYEADQGLIVEIEENTIKVEWDTGTVSYFRRDARPPIKPVKPK